MVSLMPIMRANSSSNRILRFWKYCYTFSFFLSTSYRWRRSLFMSYLRSWIIISFWSSSIISFSFVLSNNLFDACKSDKFSFNFYTVSYKLFTYSTFAILLYLSTSSFSCSLSSLQLFFFSFSYLSKPATLSSNSSIISFLSFIIF